MIKIKHLKNLEILKNSGSITAASKKINQTQSALSYQFKKLEKYLGFKLFIRKTEPLKFTIQGNILLKLCKKILPKIKKTIQKCRDLNQINIRIAIECHSCIQWLHSVFNNFKKLWPNIKIIFKSEIVFNTQLELKKEKLDIVLTSDLLCKKELFYFPLFKFEIRLILSTNHILVEKKNIITPKDLQLETIIIYPVQYEKLDIWKLFFQPSGIIPTFKNVKNTLLLIQMVSSGMGISALPYWIIKNFEYQNLIKTKKIGHGIWKTLYAVTKNEKQHKYYIQELIISIQLYGPNPIKYIRNIKKIFSSV